LAFHVDSILTFVACWQVFAELVSVLACTVQVSYKEPTPPDTELVVRSHVVAVRENQNPGLGKAAVEVDVAILLPQADGSEKLLVQVRDTARRHTSSAGAAQYVVRPWLTKAMQKGHAVLVYLSVCPI
jgi:hypothetical protein